MSLFKKLVLIVIVFALFGLGFLVGRSTVICKFCAPEDLDFSLFWEAWHKIQQEYVSPGDIDIQELIYGAISGMVESIGDPYTIFFNPGDAKKFLDDIGGEFEGIGAEIGIRERRLQIIAPLEGTPAQSVGLRPGDIVIKIDGVSTMNITIEEAVTLIRGPKGTEVTLTIMRDEWDSSEDFIIKRAIIEIPSLKWELIPARNASHSDAGGEENIAYIKLYHFSERIDQDFKEIATEILKSPAEKIILDLRGNPGGYLERSQDIAGWFLEKEQIVVIEDFGGKREQEIYRTKGNSKFLDYPIVILINQGSASASEILASALRDNRGVIMIGETSFGKGSVQKLESLRDGSSLKITIANWLTPNGDLITDKGLEPDIKIEMTEQDYEEERDPQLNKAIEIIKEIE